MSTLQTYHGVVHKGRVHISPPADLPEGSEVYAVVTGHTAVEEVIMHSSRFAESRERKNLALRDSIKFYLHKDMAET